jgi:glucokinase
MPTDSNQSARFAGVDLCGPRIFAGVFTESFQLLGKTKFSPKPERGPGVVMDRVVRCIRDAADECDLTLRDLAGIGLAVPGAVDAEAGLVLAAPRLGWENIPLRQELEQRLQLPIVLENDCNAAALAIYTQELSSKPRNLVSVFLDRPTAVGMIVQGRFASEITHNISIPAPQLQTDPRISSARNPAKQLRKAIQAGDEQAEKAVHALAQQAGLFVVQMINLFQPDVLALGGGAIEELKEWLLPVILRNIREQALPEIRDDVEIFVSSLGKITGMLGAALLSAQSALRRGDTVALPA